MSKELLIVFLYDTEVHLREEEDPQNAVVYFHPSWVSANQRMALCGQLIGVTQFLLSGFSFPHIISLHSGKFAMKKIGRYIMCVGTDRNISDWILEKRCEMLFNVLLFFHSDLKTFHIGCDSNTALEKLVNAMEIYLPILLYAGNIFGSSPTIRLPKSASGIFLEAAQILECLRNENGVYGGAIFYQNKVVMSQLSTDITKQIVLMDPFRVKIPVETLETSFQLPAGVQLLIVYVNADELQILIEQKIPSTANKKFFPEITSENENNFSINGKKQFVDNLKMDRSKIDTVLEEESELESLKLHVSEMPDVVKDTVKISTKNDNFQNIKVQSYVVDPFTKFSESNACSVVNLDASDSFSLKYCSFNHSNDSNDETSDKALPNAENKNKKSHPNRFYNTISDPVFPWFRRNGLPASKALHDDRIDFYCQDIGNAKLSELAIVSNELPKKKIVESIPKRPTSISLNSKDAGLKKKKTLNLNLKTEIPEIPEPNQESIPPTDRDIPITPLMSKLSMLDLSEPKHAISCTKLSTPSTSKCFPRIENSTNPQNDPFYAKLKIDRSKRKSYRKKSLKEEVEVDQKKTVLFVFGYQNISLYLLLSLEQAKHVDLINFLWKTCNNSFSELERHFQQCFESIPPTQSLNTGSEFYSFVQIHSAWETLQRSGTWTGPQRDLLNSLHEDLNNDPTITDVTIRLEDCVVYGYQMGDSQIFYQQNVAPVAGLPMPSDLMGVIPIKAKRRLERDHGLLIL